MLTEVKNKSFANGIVYALRTWDGYLIETTDTFLPAYRKENGLKLKPVQRSRPAISDSCGSGGARGSSC